MNYQSSDHRQLFIIIIVMYYVYIFGKRWEIRCTVIVTIIIFKLQETESRFIGAKTVLRSAPSSSFVHGLPCSYLMLSSPTHDSRAKKGEASSYLYAYHQGLGFGLFSSLYCCQMGPAVNLNGLSIIDIKYTYDYVLYIYRHSGEKKYGNTRQWKSFKKLKINLS